MSASLVKLTARQLKSPVNNPDGESSMPGSQHYGVFDSFSSDTSLDSHNMLHAKPDRTPELSPQSESEIELYGRCEDIRDRAGIDYYEF